MSTRAALLGESLQCLRWLHVNVVQSRCVSLSEEQLQQLSLAVGDDAVRVRCAVRVLLLPLLFAVYRPRW